jgi:hypothetical protein
LRTLNYEFYFWTKKRGNSSSNSQKGTGDFVVNKKELEEYFGRDVAK